jgi:hypothetical protein
MIIHHFSPENINGFCTCVTIERKAPGKDNLPEKKWDVIPQQGGLITGAFFKGDAIVITLVVDGDHKCTMLDPRNLQPLPKKPVGYGVYEKRLTITTFEGNKQVAPWPNNMLCLETGNRKFNIGIFVQDNRFYLGLEEYIPDPPTKIYENGEVKWFSLLRGIGCVASDKFDQLIHWKRIFVQRHGLRFLNSGERLEVIETTETVVNKTNFSTEIKRANVIL